MVHSTHTLVLVWGSRHGHQSNHACETLRRLCMCNGVPVDSLHHSSMLSEARPLSSDVCSLQADHGLLIPHFRCMQCVIDHLAAGHPPTGQ